MREGRAGYEVPAEKLNREISEDKKVYRMPPLKDQNVLLVNKDKLNSATGMFCRISRCDVGEIVLMNRLSDVEQTKVTFLWKPLIIFGKLTILQGDVENGNA